MKVLHIVGYIPIGGVGTFINNLIKGTKNEIDYTVLAIDKLTESSFVKELSSNGAKFWFLNISLKSHNYFKIRKRIGKYLKSNYFDVIHIHSPNLVAFINYRKIKSKVVIHSHNVKYSSNTLKKVRNYFLFKTVRKIDSRVACSEEAGRFLFKNKEFSVVPNGINMDKYYFDSVTRKK